MARIRKKGIDYFPTDVTLFADRKIRRLIAQSGAQGVAVLMRVLCEAYKEEGYFVRADDDLIFDIAEELRMDERAVRCAVDVCVKTAIFDKNMLEKHGILTSARMQHNFMIATRKRLFNNRPEDAYLLVSGSETDGSRLQTDVHGTQRKAQKRKEEKSTAEKKDARVSYAPNVEMEQQEHDALIKRYGQAQTDHMIEMLSNYKGAHGREYENDYYAILSWVVRRYNEDKPAMSNERPTENYDHLAVDLFADEGNDGGG